MPKKRSAGAGAAGDAEHDPEAKVVIEAVEEEVEEEQEEEKKPKKRAKKTKEPVNEEPHVALEGPKWMIHPPWLMYRSAVAIATFSFKERRTALSTKGTFYLGLCVHSFTCLQGHPRDTFGLRREGEPASSSKIAAFDLVRS